MGHLEKNRANRSYLCASWLAACALVIAKPAAAEIEPAKAAADTAAADTGGEPTDAPDPAAAEGEDAGPTLPWQDGPRPLELGHQIKIDLPAGYSFLGQPEAGQVMEKMGNLPDPSLLGLVVRREEEQPWFVVLSYDEEGYVEDDEEIDSEELLEAMREGLEEANVERKRRGFLELRLDGWDEKPHYDKATHHLIWNLRVSDTEGSSANYNTRILGRKGYVSVNLITDPNRVAADKPHAAAVLASTVFLPGARYEDFDESTDKVAEYGLAGLVAGGLGLGALKLVKLGLFAKLGKVLLAVLIAGKKAIIPLLVGIGYGIKKLFGGRSSTSS